MSTADSTAIVAIVIAVIAFFVTTAQLLQALFGTADGYRRCQSSVIGPWASKTRRKFRWGEFRFETIFSTPDIRLQSEKEAVRATLITGDLISRQETLIPHIESSNDSHGDLVSWLTLLHRLQVLQDAQFSSFGNQAAPRHIPQEKYPNLKKDIPGLAQESISYAVVTVRTRSWDFMPTDIVRPFASSTIGDIIAIAHRLGMEWKDLRPGENIMRAEGNGQSFSSTPIRSLGILLQYTSDRPLAEDKAQRNTSMMVCSAEADKFGFGIIPGFKDLGMSDIQIDDAQEETALKNAMRDLGIESYQWHLGVPHNHQNSFDLLPLMSPWIPLRGSNIVQIRRPCRNFPSATMWWEGLVVFKNRLRDICSNQNETSSLSQLRWVLEKYETMSSKYGWNDCPSWEEEGSNSRIKNGRDLAFLDDLYDIWRKCTKYLQDIQTRGHDSFYRDLVAAHIVQALAVPPEMDRNVGDGKDQNARWSFASFRSPHMAETMHLFIDRIPGMADFMAQKNFSDRDTVRDAWWTMILRAMCWQRSIAFVERDPSSAVVPSALYNSRAPVYIA